MVKVNRIHPHVVCIGLFVYRHFSDMVMNVWYVASYSEIIDTFYDRNRHADNLYTSSK